MLSTKVDNYLARAHSIVKYSSTLLKNEAMMGQSNMSLVIS
jgi:hypothetical protein